ncbi:MAG: MarR family transcriptional regulator [Planctomycetaceae bacterium]
MRSTLEHDDREFLADLRKSGRSTVQSLCDRLGVTATAIRQRLARLQAMGLITREASKGERGRPSHFYVVTTEGLRELGDNYRDLALMLWDEITRIEEHEVRAKLIERLRERLVQLYGRNVRAASLEDRFEELRGLLTTLGFDVELSQSTGELLPILRENHCPYHDLASRDASICDLEQTVFSEVLGVPMERIQCCRDGDQCCEFSPSQVVATSVAG